MSVSGNVSIITFTIMMHVDFANPKSYRFKDLKDQTVNMLALNVNAVLSKNTKCRELLKHEIFKFHICKLLFRHLFIDT